MRYPLWILNSALVILVILVLLFIWFSQEKIPRRGSIEPRELSVSVVKEAPTINIAKIYEHDLFDTYHEPAEPPSPSFPAPPQPPAPQKPRVPVKGKPSFLDPLPITLKGIIIVSQDDTKSMVTIADNNTNQEVIYKIGDIIEDAQLIRIFRNKVIFVRSNGQQEILYLREKDAKSDPVYAFLDGWDEVIEKKSDTEFSVDPQLFIERVTNLAQMIDVLNLTTAYKRGKSIGCRIGSIEDNSLGTVLGLKAGDIILTVNGIPATDTSNRYSIYKSVIEAKTDDKITVNLQRSGQPLEIFYLLEERIKPEVQLESAPITERAARPEEIKEKELKSMRDRYSFAPTLEQIRTREKENMQRRGKRPNNSIAE